MENENQQGQPPDSTVTASPPPTETPTDAVPDIPLRARRREYEQEEEESEDRGRLKKIVIVVVILLLLLLALLYLAGLRKPPAPPPPRVEPLTWNGPWTDVATFTGNKSGVATSKRFDIAGTQWRVVWSSRPKDALSELDNSVIFFLRPLKRYAKPSDNVVVVGTTSEPRSATWNIRTLPGGYYFQILSRNADWSIKVQQMVSPVKK